MIADPPVRPDLTCDVCGEPLPRSKQGRRYAGAHLDADPFCSTACCRIFHGQPLPDTITERRRAAAREQAQRFRERYASAPE